MKIQFFVSNCTLISILSQIFKILKSLVLNGKYSEIYQQRFSFWLDVSQILRVI